MGRARGHLNAVVGNDRFADVLGARRGSNHPTGSGELYLARQSEELARIIAVDGVEGVVRFYRQSSPLTSTTMQAHVGDALAALMFDECYAKREPLAAWLRDVGLRPYWCQNIAATGMLAHLIPTGHQHADRIDLNESRPITACGRGPTAWLLLNRGGWTHIRTSINPAMTRCCEDCLPLAGAYPESSAEDAKNLLPASALAITRHEWMERARELIRSGLETGADIMELRSRVNPLLADLVIDWGADELAQNTYPSVLRALRANNIVSVTESRGPKQITQDIISSRLNAADWRALLNSHRGASSVSRNTWAQLLLTTFSPARIHAPA